jgi:hypothetical protein
VWNHAADYFVFEDEDINPGLVHDIRLLVPGLVREDVEDGTPIYLRTMFLDRKIIIKKSTVGTDVLTIEGKYDTQEGWVRADQPTSWYTCESMLSDIAEWNDGTYEMLGWGNGDGDTCFFRFLEKGGGCLVPIDDKNGVIEAAKYYEEVLGNVDVEMAVNAARFT